MDPTGSVKKINSICIWDINNFSSKCSKNGEYITSPYFAAGDIPLDEIKWYFKLYPFGRDIESQSFLSIYLHAKFLTDLKECKVSCKFYLWNENEMIKNEFEIGKFTKGTGWGEPQFLKRNGHEIKNHLSMSLNDALSIACCIITPCYGKIINLHSELMKGVNSFLLSEKLSDVTIEIDDEKLKAHKFILSARSQVFSAMFDHNTIESSENIIKITDISCDVMREVLRFMYCEKVENLEKFKRDLLVAADKYDIRSLKAVCEEALLESMNLNNVCETLSIADLYKCNDLKREAIKLIIKNMKAVVDSEEFNKITDHNLLADILRKVALKINT